MATTEGENQENPNQQKINSLLSLERLLKERIRGQDHAIQKVMEIVEQGELGLSSPDKPKGRFLFLGPTGVGKTETAKLVSNFLFGENHFFRFDMSEFVHKDAVRKFIGDESGDLGRLGDALATGRAQVLLFDEIEKANRDVLMLFLQMLDDARITCGKGKLFNLSNAYIIGTSNIGGKDVMSSKHLPLSQIEAHVLDMLREQMPPEFGPRFPTKIVFNRLSTQAQFEIARDILHNELERLAMLGHTLTPKESVYDFLVRVGYDRINGARPMKDSVQLHVRKAVANHLKKNLSDKTLGTLTVSPCEQLLMVKT